VTFITLVTFVLLTWGVNRKKCMRSSLTQTHETTKLTGDSGTQKEE
jgi:hypothetical protein